MNVLLAFNNGAKAAMAVWLGSGQNVLSMHKNGKLRTRSSNFVYFLVFYLGDCLHLYVRS